MTEPQEQAAVFFLFMTCAFGLVYSLKVLHKITLQIVTEVRRILNATK
jgi:hypothetical protein